MPDISNIPVPQYQPNQPYHWSYDNLPFQSLIVRDDLINAATDANTVALENAAGNAGTVALRLNQSLETNGDLKTAAVDTSLHNIGAHTDGTFTVSGPELSAYQADYPLVTNPVPFVRMLEAEREKLALIADSATSIGIDFPDAALSFNNGTVSFADSETITWTSVAGQTVRADLMVSYLNNHQHYDGVIPQSLDPTPDYQNYITGVGYPVFTAGTLKVFINGVRIFSGVTVNHPTTDPLATWTANSFTENAGTGFTLLNPINPDDIIVIDFEVAL